MRFLFLSTTLPIPPHTGDRQRTFLLYKALERLGEVDIVVIRNAAKIDHDVLVEAKSKWNLIKHIDLPRGIGLPSKVIRKINVILNPTYEYKANSTVSAQVSGLLELGKYDIIVVRYFQLAMIADVLNNKIPIALDMDDYEPERFRSEAERNDLSCLRKKLLHRKSIKISNLIAANASRFATIWGANAADCMQPGLKLLSCLPNIPFTENKSVRSKELYPSNLWDSPTLLVVTSRNRGNVEGIIRFGKTALQSLRKIKPNIKLKVIGSNLPKEIYERLRKIPGMQILGHVENISNHYRECILTIAPVAFGAGTSIKVLESFAHGRPCIMNDFAARGLKDLPSGILDKLKVDRIEDMDKLIIPILDDCSCTLGLQCKDWVRANRNKDVFYDIVSSKLLDVKSGY